MPSIDAWAPPSPDPAAGAGRSAGLETGRDLSRTGGDRGLPTDLPPAPRQLDQRPGPCSGSSGRDPDCLGNRGSRRGDRNRFRRRRPVESCARIRIWTRRGRRGARCLAMTLVVRGRMILGIGRGVALLRQGAVRRGPMAGFDRATAALAERSDGASLGPVRRRDFADSPRTRGNGYDAATCAIRCLVR